MSGRKDFLNQPAPENYVAGLGRGATGFTTRSDLGPAREGPSEDQVGVRRNAPWILLTTDAQIKAALQKRAEQLGTAAPSAYGVPEKKADDDDDDERFQDPENETGLFAGGDFTREDQEADDIYAAVDEKMEKRRRARRYVNLSLATFLPTTSRITGSLHIPIQRGRITDLKLVETFREAREAQERAEYEANNPKIQQQFSDLKRGLSSMSEEDWANLPEPGDLTRKNKRLKQDRMANARHYAVPDSVIAGARDSMQLDTTVQDDGPATNGSTTDGVDGTLTDFRSIGQARDKVLQLRLDQATTAENGASANSGTATTIDPKGYLTSLTKSEIKAGEVEVADVNRVRVLLDSVIKTNKHHAPGHIALCRLESVAGRTMAARKAIMRGTELCPTSEDIWQEAITVHQEGDNHNAKITAAKALQACPMSTQLWLRAMSLENDSISKKRVLRKALDLIPKSVQLWKQLINLQEDTNEAKLLMAKATEECPFSIELHIGLANVEFSNGNKEAAMAVLNKARSLIPTSHEIWCAAIKLSEAIGKLPPDRVAKAAVKSLAQNSAMLKREEWIAEAEKCEAEAAPRSAAAIIQETLAYGLDPDDEDLRTIFLEDAEASIQRNKFVTARAIFAYLLRLFPTSKTAWKKSVEFEKAHGSREEYWRLLEKSCEACPDAEEFWIMNSRAKWEAGEKTEARRVLGRSFKQLSSNENVFLSAVELEVKDGQISEASTLLQTARQEAGTSRIWYISVDFARKYGDGDGADKNSTALDLVNQGLQLYPSEPRLHMQKGQIYAAMGKIPQAREAYSVGTRACKSSVHLYLLLSRLEESQGLITKARSVLERGVLNCKSPLIALEAIRVERRAGNLAQAKALMARALQQFPTSGLLWSENIWHLEDRTKRKPRSLEAIKKVDNDPSLFVTVARVFWTERKLDKAASWFEKAILLDPDLGDTWAWYQRFLNEYGTDEKKAEVLEKLRAQEPRHGELWAKVRKDPQNAGIGPEEVLKIVVEGLE